MIPDAVTEFINSNKDIKHCFEPIPDPIPNGIGPVSWILSSSGAPWIDMQLEIPAAAMLEEAKQLKKEFVKHRFSDGYGWSSLAIHGISKTHTMSANAYGLEENLDLYHYTEIADQCPVTINFLKNLPGIRFGRVRFMLLESQGYIKPHKDNWNNYIASAMNISLNNPNDCRLVVENFGTLPFSNSGSALFFNNYYKHSVVNLSNEDRYHMIIHGDFDFDVWGEKLVACYNAQLQ